MTRAAAITALHTGGETAAGNVLSNTTDAELEGFLYARSLGHAPRNLGSLGEREIAALAAFDLAQS